MALESNKRRVRQVLSPSLVPTLQLVRAGAVAMLLVAGCSVGPGGDGSGSTGSSEDAGDHVGGTPDAALPADGGSEPDAGLTADGGSQSDAGLPVDGGPAPDAGAPPARIDSVPCPGQPPLLWSRTFSDEVDFRGAADEDGNVYWIEYDPPPTFTAEGSPWLVSASRDGANRYRVPISVASRGGVFLIAAGKVVLSNGARLAAYDAASAAPSWMIDQRVKYPGDARVSGIADLGNGNLAFSLSEYGTASGLFVVDMAAGEIVWSSIADAEYRVAGSEGAGSALVTAHRTSVYSTDLFAIDAGGREVWTQELPGSDSRNGALLAWFADPPWLWAAADTQTLTPAGHYVAVPSTWFSAVRGSDWGFGFFFGATATTPDAVAVVHGGAVVAEGAIVGSNPEDGLSVFPFLAGESGNHLLLLSQKWHSSPGLCHPSRAEAAALSRFDATSSYRCPFAFEGESAIEGAALLEARVVLGRRTYLTDGCTYDVQPVTIEAYAVPGESLAPSGWVQRAGSPGLGMRPRTR
jgi:PQQ-like domain